MVGGNIAVDMTGATVCRRRTPAAPSARAQEVSSTSSQSPNPEGLAVHRIGPATERPRGHRKPRNAGAAATPLQRKCLPRTFRAMSSACAGTLPPPEVRWTTTAQRKRDGLPDGGHAATAARAPRARRAGVGSACREPRELSPRRVDRARRCSYDSPFEGVETKGLSLGRGSPYCVARRAGHGAQWPAE